MAQRMYRRSGDIWKTRDTSAKNSTGMPKREISLYTVMMSMWSYQTAREAVLATVRRKGMPCASKMPIMHGIITHLLQKLSA